MSWIYLIVAGLFEVAFTSCMGKVKETTGSEMYWWFTGFIISMSISMFLLIKATQALPIGTAYAVWTGIGAVGTVLAGILIFKEPSTIWRLFFYCNADRFDYRFESSISLKQKNRMPIDIDILFFYILNYLDYFFTSTITRVLSAS